MTGRPGRAHRYTVTVGHGVILPGLQGGPGVLVDGVPVPDGAAVAVEPGQVLTVPGPYTHPSLGESQGGPTETKG